MRSKSWWVIGGSILAGLVSLRSVWAAPVRQTASLDTAGTQRTLVLPSAADKAPVIYLGSAVDPQTGEAVEGYALIRYKEEAVRSANPAKPAKTLQCYAYLSSGAKWRVIEPWVVNPGNMRGLGSEFVFANLGGDIGKWEDAADGVVGNAAGVEVLGEGAVTAEALVADQTAPDGNNEVYFANVSTQNAIAVTIVWGVFGGPPAGRKLVEWDQVYDDVDFDWSASGETGKMDFENIATHELGHSVGMADLYTASCTEETMYGYASTGETKKRDLYTGDVVGVDKLY